MDVNAIITKIKLRVNKLDSQDYDNLMIWQILEAFNRAQLLFVRSNLQGYNLLNEGDEQSKRRIDDFQRLLTNVTLSPVKKTKTYTELGPYPDDYLLFKKLDVLAKLCDKDNPYSCDEEKSLKVYLVEEANSTHYYEDELTSPDFAWGETFATIIRDRFRVYVKGFDIVSGTLTYYRKPRLVEKAGNVTIGSGSSSVPTVDVEPEFNDDVVESIINLAAQLIDGDIQDGYGYNVNKTTYRENN